TPITRDDTTGTLGERLAALGATAIGEAIDGLHAGTLRAQPQPQEGVTFAPKIEREQARLDWTRPAVELERFVRAIQPAPAAPRPSRPRGRGPLGHPAGRRAGCWRPVPPASTSRPATAPSVSSRCSSKAGSAWPSARSWLAIRCRRGRDWSDRPGSPRRRPG